MKCGECAFKDQTIEMAMLGIIYTCKLQGIRPEPDCPYFKQKTEPTKDDSFDVETKH